MSAVLVIAGSDSSGGAGVARDLATLTELGVPAMCAITAVTAQTNAALISSHHVPPDSVRAQIAAAFATRAVGAVKIGMLGNAATVAAVSEALAPHPRVPIVLDPVLVASAGGVLLDEAGRTALRTLLFARLALLTPNIPEAALLLGCAAAGDEDEARTQAQQLLGYGPRAVLIKGGHARGSECVDLLAQADTLERLVMPRIAARLRGTGCALSTAIAGYLASGLPLPVACRRAKAHVSTLLQRGA